MEAAVGGTHRGKETLSSSSPFHRSVVWAAFTTF